MLKGLFFLFTLRKYNISHKSRKYFRMQAKECMYRIRIEGWVWFDGTTGGHLVQPAQARSSQSTCHSTVSRWFLNISLEGDSKTFLVNLCQCSVTCMVKKLFLMFKWSFLCISLCPLLLDLLLSTPEQTLDPPSSLPACTHRQ